MKFSIITPSFNHGRFIRDCIQSVQAQEGVECEHIVTDAGSTDETLSILREYPHLKWSSAPDKGMSDGINKGFLQATGDWLMWLNTDDYLLPGVLRKVVQHAQKNPQADLIYGDCLFVDEQKRLLRHKREHGFDFNVLLFYGCYIPSTSTFLRRKIVQSGELLDVELKVCMDFDYYVRLALHGYRFSYLPEALAGFRWHEANASIVLGRRRYEERVKVQRRYLRELGRSWLGREFLLKILFRVYQLKRGVLCKLDHGRQRSNA